MSERESTIDCPACKAKGYVDEKCARCMGTGEACARCEGMGYTRDENDRLVACPCGLVQQRQAKQARLASLTALRGRLLECSFDGFETGGEETKYATAAFNAAREWAESPRGFLTIWSTTKGNGKTHLAAAAANHLIAHGEVVMFVNSPELMDALRSCFNDGRSVQKLTGMVADAPVLIVDDFGAEKRSAWTDERAYIIVNSRLERGLPTLFTTNVPPGALEERILSRVTNRGSRVVENHAGEYER